jgi:hypothetical protein
MDMTDRLIKAIEDHGASAVRFRGAIMATCGATLRTADGTVMKFDMTNILPANREAIACWLGY